MATTQLKRIPRVPYPSHGTSDITLPPIRTLLTSTEDFHSVFEHQQIAYTIPSPGSYNTDIIPSRPGSAGTYTSSISYRRTSSDSDKGYYTTTENNNGGEARQPNKRAKRNPATERLMKSTKNEAERYRRKASTIGLSFGEVTKSLMSRLDDNAMDEWNTDHRLSLQNQKSGLVVSKEYTQHQARADQRKLAIRQIHEKYPELTPHQAEALFEQRWRDHFHEQYFDQEKRHNENKAGKRKLILMDEQIHAVLEARREMVHKDFLRNELKQDPKWKDQDIECEVDRRWRKVLSVAPPQCDFNGKSVDYWLGFSIISASGSE